MTRSLAVLALAGAISCKKEAPPPAPVEKPAVAPPASVTETEPNDYQHAQQLPARAVVSGSISGPKDDDWYRVSGAPALRVELKGLADASIEIYDRDRNKLLKAQGLVPAVACGESCFVKIDGPTAGPYTLTVLGGPPPAGQELEPNNRAVDATPLTPGKPMSGTYGAGDDEDWYRLPLSPSAGDFLRIEVSAVPEVRPELEVRSLADGALLASLRGPGPGEALFVRDLSLQLGAVPVARVVLAPTAEDAGVDAGTPAAAAPAAPATPPPGYYLVLKSSWYASGAGKKSVRGAAPLTPYTLTATVEQGAPDLEAEPNDDAQHATPAGATASGFVAPAGDQDWFRVHAAAPSVLHLELSGADRADLELTVFAADGKQKLAHVNEAGLRESEIVPAVGVPAGDAFVLVQAAARQLDGKWVRDGEDRQNLYRLSVQMSPDDGSVEREPNNDLANAQELPKLPASVRGWIWPRKDVDVFKFHVSADHPPVSIRLPAVRGTDLMLRLTQLHGSSAEVIGTSDSSKGEGDEQLLSVPLKEGDYAVEVSSPHNKDASATQPYQLSVQ